MIWSKIDELHKQGKPFVIITLVSSRGHAPQDPGAKALVTSEGLQFGTVGGGKVEAKAIAHSKNLISEPSAQSVPQLLTWNLTTDVGMTCGGEVTFLFEPVTTRPWNIAVFGAGHVAQALVRVLANLDCRVDCIDSRQEWLEKLPEAPNLRKVYIDKPSDHVQTLSPSHFFVVMTQGHATDLPILKEIFNLYTNPAYVGAIGSDVKARILKADLAKADVSPAQLERFHSPIGLDLGSNHPYEIAISIAAQLIQERDKSC